MPGAYPRPMPRLTPRKIARRLRRRGRRLADAARRRLAEARTSKLVLKYKVLRRYGAFRRTPIAAVRYLLLDQEIDNFTYDVVNPRELANHLATVLGVSPDAAWDRVRELADDDELLRDVAEATARRRDRNARMPFGRRAGWYATVRLLRPQVVVETGVHDGLGSTALLRALQRNAAEGDEGVLVSFDVNSAAGWLVPTALRSRHELVVGTSVDAMAEALRGRPIDLFIHDSDHRYEYERRELEVAASLGSDRAVYLSDNAHATTALRDFAADRGLDFSYWQERVRGHFYPGGGIGIAAPRVPLAKPR